MTRPYKKRKPVEVPAPFAGIGTDDPVVDLDGIITPIGLHVPENVVKEAERLGFTPMQIMGFSSLEALKSAIYHIDPTARNRLEPPVTKTVTKSICIEPPKPVMVDKVETFTVSIDAQWIISANHASCEEMQIQSQLRGRRIRNIQSLSIVRSYIPDKKSQLVSQVTVNYKDVS